MATRTEYQHGEFSWVTLSTSDVAAAKRFYGGLFGWQFNDMPAGPGQTYTFCELNHKSVGGLSALTPEMGNAPPHWMPFVNVRSADEIGKRVAKNGGKVLYGPEDVLDVGRMGAFADPTGARLAFWEPKRHKGAALVGETGAICWNEVLTPDIEAAGRFYRAVYDWSSDLVDTSEDSSYTIFKAGNNMIAGMMARPARLKDVPPNWLTYFGTDDVDASAAKVRELGGKVMQPPTDIPGIGRFAVCQDGQGAVFAIAKFIPPAQ
ncbi:MAG TPA: VOC family protein [bacterium]|nr:VOC family protein [bacterium]